MLSERDPVKPSTDSALPELRKLSDAESLRALAHPVRLALVEVLTVEGPLTATEAGEKIGESPTTCSFHLRQLARYGFVEEAGGGKGRARPWRMSKIGMTFSSMQQDPETAVAASALARMLRDRQLQRYQTWLDTKASYPQVWQAAAGNSEVVCWLTAAELAELTEDLVGLLLSRFTERIGDPSARPPGAVPVELLVFSYPITLPAAGS